jgi:membrane-associated phospholipid phosphatase
MTSRQAAGPGPRWLCVLVLAVSCSGAAEAQARSTTQTVGDVGQVAIPATALLAAGIHSDGRGVVQLAESLGTSLAVVYTLKPTIDRRRPDGGRYSFPSGHAAAAFAGASFLHLRYGWAWGAPAYAAAVFVGYSRVESKQHFTSDVVAGGAIGIASNLVFTRRYRKVHVTPLVGAGTVGLGLHASW